MDFSFDNCVRNNNLDSSLSQILPKAIKTGTTIVGLCYKNGVILAADTRSTEGPIVADKNCQKLHYISDNIYCAGAGTAADTEHTTAVLSSQLELMKLNNRTAPRVKTAMTRLKRYLFQYQGYISAYLILGGVDVTGSHLYSIHAHGSVDKLPFTTLGSGSLAAMSVLESGYKDDMNEEEAIHLADKAVQSGIFNDLGSGGNVDMVLITLEGTKILRNYQKPNVKMTLNREYKFPIGTTSYFEEIITSNTITQSYY